MLKVTNNYDKRAKIGPNGVFRHFLNVFVFLIFKKCTPTNNFGTS
jgi:hypothetical protein